MHTKPDSPVDITHTLNKIQFLYIDLLDKFLLIESKLKDNPYLPLHREIIQCKEILIHMKNNQALFQRNYTMNQLKREHQSENLDKRSTQHYPLLECHTQDPTLYEDAKKPKVDGDFNSPSSNLKTFLKSPWGLNKRLSPQHTRLSFIREYNPVFRYILNSPIDEWLIPPPAGLDQKPTVKVVNKTGSSLIAHTHNTFNATTDSNCKAINFKQISKFSLKDAPHTRPEDLHQNDIFSLEPIDDFISIRSREPSSKLSPSSSLDSFCVLDDKDFFNHAVETQPHNVDAFLNLVTKSGDLCELVQSMDLTGDSFNHHHVVCDSAPSKKCHEGDFLNNYPTHSKKQKYNYQEWLVSQS